MLALRPIARERFCHDDHPVCQAHYRHQQHDIQDDDNAITTIAIIDLPRPVSAKSARIMTDFGVKV